MDIFRDKLDRENQLKGFRQKTCIFSIMRNSTCSVDGLLSNVIFEEKDIIDFMECTGNIMTIDCNYGHIRQKNYVKVEPKKSNRGRKKKKKPVKPRKKQGDGSAFCSQISFGTKGSHVRYIVPPGRYSETVKKDHEIKKLTHETELVTKIYKIKLFRNGSITIPGILTEDMSDVIQPINELAIYLSGIFLADVKRVNLFSVMRNYKFYLLEGYIDIIKLQRYCEDHFHNLLNTRISDIVEFLINPIFSDIDISPMFDGWNKMFSALDDDDISISFDEMHRYLHDSSNLKNLYVDFESLCKKIKKFDINQIYSAIWNFYNSVHDNYMNVPDTIYANILRYMLSSFISELELKLSTSKDNLLSHIKYDSEKYPGFLIKVKTPNAVNSAKKTTIKIFPGGKINIDGANSRDEAEFIYWWLNNIFTESPDLLYNDNFNYEDSDSEFSSDSEVTD